MKQKTLIVGIGLVALFSNAVASAAAGKNIKDAQQAIGKALQPKHFQTYSADMAYTLQFVGASQVIEKITAFIDELNAELEQLMSDKAEWPEVTQFEKNIPIFSKTFDNVVYTTAQKISADLGQRVCQKPRCAFGWSLKEKELDFANKIYRDLPLPVVQGQEGQEEVPYRLYGLIIGVNGLSAALQAYQELPQQILACVKGQVPSAELFTPIFTDFDKKLSKNAPFDRVGCTCTFLLMPTKAGQKVYGIVLSSAGIYVRKAGHWGGNWTVQRSIRVDSKTKFDSVGVPYVNRANPYLQLGLTDIVVPSRTLKLLGLHAIKEGDAQFSTQSTQPVVVEIDGTYDHYLIATSEPDPQILLPAEQVADAITAYTKRKDLSDDTIYLLVSKQN